MANTNHINLDYLHSMSGGMNELIIEMIDLFRDQIPEFLERMKKALNDKNWSELSEAAHKAKSSINIMGMDDLGNELNELEMKAKEAKATDTYSETVSRFEKVTNEALVELDEIVKKLSD